MIVDGWTGGQLFSNNVEGAGSGPATPCAFPMFDTDARHDRRQEKRSTMPTNAAPRSPKTTTRRCRHLALVLILLAALWPISAGAAVTLVKNIGKTGSTTTGTSLSVTVPAADVAAGNRVIVSVALDPTAGTVSCADSKGNVYAKDVDVTQGSGTSGVRSVIFSAPITAALVSGNTITVTHPSLAARAMSADEFSGLGTSGTLDKTASATGSSTSPSSGTTATTSQPSELLIGAIDVETRGDTFTVGSGYTSLASISSASNGNATSNVTMNAEYRIVSATGGYAANGTLGTARQWAAGIATYRAAACGNGIVDAGEQCDGGACCSATCTFLSSATVCRAAAGECDLAETCTGSAATCPADAKKASGTACTDDGNVCTVDRCDGSNITCQHPAGNAGTVCRASTGACDPAETCTGTSTTCPADAKSPAGTVCRAAVGSCDVAETCDGTSGACPADGFASASVQCRAAAGECDTAEFCPGNGPNCPADAKKPAGTVCRAAAGACDIAETCTGSSSTCPADAFQPSTFTCRAAVNECDIAENCPGNGPNCPADVVKSAGTACTDDGNVCTTDQCNGTVGSPACTHPAGNAGAVCRPSAGDCDVPETCTGTSTTCPPDGVAPNTTVCRPSGGDCDLEESCSGTSPTCPPDTFKPNTTVCRAASNECDVAETCSGTSTNCPPDVVMAAGTTCTDDGNVCTTDICNGTIGAPACIHPAGHAGDVCRSATGPCDIADTCDGLNNSCPPDGFLPATTVCRTAAGECDVTEYCTGTASDCPGDAKVAAGTSCTDDGNVCTADECDGTSDLCRHTLVCPKPVANAGHNTSGLTGATITLDGSGSSDPDGGALTYQWSISSKPDGSNAALADPAVVTPTITPDLPGHYDMRLVVNNGRLDSDPATVTVAACVEMSAQELQTAASGGGWLATLQHARSLGYSDIGPARSCPDGATSLIVATMTNAAGESVVLTHNQTFDTAFLLLPSATGSVTVFNETGGVVISPDGTTQTVAPDGHTATAQAADGSCKDYWLFVLCQAAQQFRTAFVTCGPWMAEAIACVLFSPDLVTKAYCLSVVAVANQQNILQCLFGTPQIGNPNCQDVSNGRNCPTGTVCATGGCFHGGCKLTPVADSTPCDADFYGVPRCLTSISFRDSALCVGGRCTPVTQECEPCEVCPAGDDFCQDIHAVGPVLAHATVSHLFGPYCVGTLQCNVSAVVDASYFDCDGAQVGSCTGSDYEARFNWNCGDPPCNAQYVSDVSLHNLDYNCQGPRFSIGQVDPSLQLDPYDPNGKYVWSIPESRQGCCNSPPP